MHLIDWLCEVRTAFTTMISPARRRRPVSRRSLEKLEDRLMLTYTVTLNGTDLTFTGDNAADTLEITRLSGHIAYSVNGGAAIDDLDLGTPGNQFLLDTDVTSITVDAGGGDDDIELGSLNLPAATKVDLDGGNEADTIVLSNLQLGGLASHLLAKAAVITLDLPAVGSISTNADQLYDGDVQLASDANLVSAGFFSDVTFEGKVDSLGAARALTVSAPLSIVFEGSVGSVPLSELITGGNALTIFGTASAVSVTTTGNQTYNTPVQLNQDTTLTSTGAAGNITFASSIKSLGAGNLRSLAVTAGGLITFQGQVGTDPLSELTTNGTGTTVFDAAVATTVTTEGNQTYNTAVQLKQDTALVSTGAAGNVTFAKTVDSAAAAKSLAVTANGLITFQDAVGATPLSQLTTDGNSTTVFDVAAVTTVITTGDQSYNTPVQLKQDTALVSTGAGGAVSFAKTVDSAAAAKSLAVTANGLITFQEAVGTTTLSQLTTNGTGTTVFDVAAATTVTTTGDQTYNTAVQLKQDTSFISTGAAGNVTFAKAVDSAAAAKSLSVSANGLITFQGAVGTTPLSQLTTSGTGTTVFDVAAATTVTTTGDQTYNTAVQLKQDTLLVSTGAAANVKFAKTVDSAAAAKSLSVTANGLITFQGAVGTTPLSQLTTNGTGTTVFDVAAATTVMTTGDQAYNTAVQLKQDTVLVSTGAAGNVTFAKTVDSAGAAKSLSVTANGLITFQGVVGATPLSELTTNGAGATVFDVVAATTVTTVGNQTYNNAVQLKQDTKLATATDVSFNSTLNSFGLTFRSLTVDAAGNTNFGDGAGNDFVGNLFPLLSLATSAAGTTTFNINGAGSSIRTSNTQTYGDKVVVAVDTVLTTNNADVEFQDSVTLNGNLTVEVGTANSKFDDKVIGNNHSLKVTGNAVLGDSDADTVTGLTTLQVTGTTLINTITVSSSGNQTYGGAVTLGTDTELTVTGPTGNVLFQSTVNSTAATEKSLTLAFTDNTNTAGTITFQGPVGGLRALSQLTTNGQGTTVFDVTAAATVTTSGNQTYNTAVQLKQDTVLVSTGAAGNVTFAKTVDSAAAARSLAVTAGGTIAFQGNVGTTPLSALTTNGGTTVFGEAAAITVTTTGDQIYNTAVQLKQDTALASTGAAGNVTFAKTVDSVAVARSLTVTANGLITFQGVVGATPLAALTLKGTTIFDVAAVTTVTTIGDQTYSNPVLLKQDTTLVSGANVTFASTIDSVAAAKSLDVTAAQAITFRGQVGNVPLSTMTTNGTATTVFDVAAAITVATIGNQTYNTAVQLNQNTTLVAGAAGNVTFAKTVDSETAAAPKSLSVAAGGLITFQGAVGTIPLSQLTTGGTATTVFDVAAATTVNTTGNQTYNTPVQLKRDTTLIAVAAGNVTFAKTVDSETAASPRSLSVSAGGLITFQGAVGTIPLSQLTTAGNGTTVFDVAAATTVTTVGNQTYNTPVQLKQDTVLVSTGAAGNVTFAKTVDSAAAAKSLTVTAGGLITFQGAVGTTPLSQLTTNGTATTVFDAAAATTVKTTGNQTYNTAVQLKQDTVLVSTDVAGNVTFAKTIDSATAASPKSLRVTAGGLITFQGAVGAIPLSQLFTIGTATTIFDVAAPTTVNTTGMQTYNTAVKLKQDTTLVAGAAGNVTFAKTVDSDTAADPKSLSVTAGGLITFKGAVGTTPLSQLTTNGNGTTVFDVAAATTVTTTGNQTYNTAVQLKQDTALVSTGAAGNVTFAKTVDSAAAPKALSVTANGLITFQGAVGTTPLSQLTTNGGGITVFDVAAATTVTTTASQTYNTAVQLKQNTVLVSTDVAGNVTFAKTVDSAAAARSLSVTANGLITFRGAVGTNPLSQLTTNGNGTTVFDVAAPITVTTTGDQFYNTVVQLNQDTVLVSSANVTFAKTIGSAVPKSLEITATQLITFHGAVGVQPLSQLTTNGATARTLFDVAANPAVTTVGDQTYNTAVQLQQDTTLLSTGATGDVTFAKTVDSQAAARSLNVTAGGLITFHGMVGTVPLSQLTTNGTATTVFDVAAPITVTTIGNQTYNTAVQLKQDTALLSTGAAGNMTFAKTVDSETAANPKSLTVTAEGTIAFQGLVGAVPLSTLTTNSVSGTGITVFGETTAITITTTGNQTYNTAVQLKQDAALTSTGAAGNVTFARTIDTSAAAAAAKSLTVTLAGVTNANGAISFRGQVGAASPLLDLTTNGFGKTIFEVAVPTSVTTVRNQTYNTAVQLNLDTTLISTGAGGAVTFAKTVDSATLAAPRSLSVTAVGDITFHGQVGAIPLSQLTTRGNGSTVFDVTGVPAVTTTGDQTYHNAVLLEQATTLTSGNNVTFNNSVNSFNANHRALTVTAVGITTFGDGNGGDRVGNLNPLLSLTTGATGTTVFNLDGGVESLITDDYQLYQNRVNLLHDTQLTALGLPSSIPTGNITFLGALDTAAASSSFRSLVLQAGLDGTIRFADNIGVQRPLGSTADAAMTILRGRTVKFDATVAHVNLNGPLLINDPSVDVAGQLDGNGKPITQITGVRNVQDVVQIVVSGTSANHLTLSNLSITNQGNPPDLHPATLAAPQENATAGNGIKVLGGGTLQFIDLDHLVVDNNDRNGLLISGATDLTVTNNEINGNLSNGILMTDVIDAMISGNHIFNNGQAATGTAAGIRIRNSVAPVTPSAGNQILSNSIFGNGPANQGVGIDLVGGDQLTTGMTLNDKDTATAHLSDDSFLPGANAAIKNTSDADSGPNGLQNFPEISYVYADNGALQIYYSVPTIDQAAYGAQNRLRIQFFVANDITAEQANAASSADDWREGRTFIAEADYDYAFFAQTQQAEVPLPLLATTLGFASVDELQTFMRDKGLRIVATATDANNNTSEFSRAAAVNAKPGTDSNGIPTPTNLTGDILAQAGYMYVPGPRVPVAGEVPAFEFHWATDGDNNKDIANQNPAAFFNDELGVYSLDSVQTSGSGVNTTYTGIVNNGVSSGASNTTDPTYDQFLLNVLLDQMNDPNTDPSKYSDLRDTVIRNYMFGYLRSKSTSSATTNLDVQYVSMISSLHDFLQVFLGPGADIDNLGQPNDLGQQNAYKGTVLLIGQEEMQLVSIDVAHATTDENLGPNRDPANPLEFRVDGATYYQYHLQLTVIRHINGTPAQTHPGDVPTIPTATNPLGVPLVPFLLMVRGTSEVPVTDTNPNNLNQMGFYLVQNGSYMELIGENPHNNIQNPAGGGANPLPDHPQAFYSLKLANQDQSDRKNHFRTEFGDTQFRDGVALPNYGVLKLYWSDRFNLGFYGQSPSVPPRGIKDAVVTVVDPFVQPLKGPGSITQLKNAESPPYSSPTDSGNPPPVTPSLGLELQPAAWVNGTGTSIGIVSREDSTESVTITLVHSGNTTIKVGDQVFGPGTAATITLLAGQKQQQFEIIDIPKKTTISVTATADGFKSKTKSVKGPKGHPPKPPKPPKPHKSVDEGRSAGED